MLQRGLGGKVSRSAEQPRPRVRAGAAEVESSDRHRVASPPGHGPHEENLIERQLAVRERALGDAKLLLAIRRRNTACRGSSPRSGDLPLDGGGHLFLERRSAGRVPIPLLSA